ncbi:phosphotriesterase family protein [Nocardia aurantia]|uniref:phosphotriesterase family protein n=1 Tax=Nocardia aurantia TaxID=2585199 RepID=UPI0029E80B4A|nr:phosphotriesterase [Nocardia aurantia]
MLGDIDPAEFGVCDAHDHLFIRTPKLPGQALDDAEAARAELVSFAGAGGRAVVQWTPWGMGGRLADLPGLSRDTGVHLVAATGLHQAAHYDPAELSTVYDDLAELFVRQLTEPPVRAGMIKAAGDFHHAGEHSRHVLAAAAAAHHATGAPIGVHLEAGTAAPDVLGILCGEHNMPPASVILGHLHRSPDTRIHREVAAAGAYVQFDGPSRAHHATDWRLLDSLAALVDAGHADRILLGADTVTPSMRATGEGPGMPFLVGGLRARIARELGDDVTTAVFVTNPARAFAAEWR